MADVVMRNAGRRPPRHWCRLRWLLGGALAAAASACGTPPQPAPAPLPSTVRVGIPQPAGAPTADAAVSQVAELLQYAALVKLDDDGSIAPGLAENWQSSADGLRWRFTLRAGLTFVDGARLDAPAVAAVLDSERRGAQPMPGLRDITAVTAESPTVLVIEQRAYSSLLLEALSALWIVGGRSGEATAGPYRVVSRNGDRVLLEAFDGYYRGRPSVDRIELQGYPSARAAWVSLMRDEIDFLYEVPPEAAEFVEAGTDIQAFPVLRTYVHLLGFNLTHPILRDARVRRALSMAVDRRALISLAFGGRGLEASGTVWPHHWASDVTSGLRRPDPAGAEALLADVFPGRASGPGRPLLSLSCVLPAGYPAFERTALVLQRQFLDVGVDLRTEVVPVAELGQRLGAGQFETYLFEQAAGKWLNWTYWFLHSPGDTQPWIRSGYSAADGALDRIRAARDRNDLRTAVRELQRVLVDDPPAVFLAWRETTRAVGRRFTIPDDTDHDIFASLSRWTPRPPEAER